MIRDFSVVVGVLSALTVSAIAQGTNAVSWIGNSLATPNKWVVQDIADICATGDGTVYTNVFWDEAGGNQQQFKDGTLLGIAGYSRGWGHEGGDAVTANKTYVYYVQAWSNEGGGLYTGFGGTNFPPTGYNWFGVTRRNRSDIRTTTAFTGGKGGKESLPGSFLVVHEIPTDTIAAICGLHATETELFVSCVYDDSVRVYDATTMALKRKWKVVDPYDLTVDAQGNVWVITGVAGAAIERYSATGAKLAQSIALPQGAKAVDICIDRTNRLLVADGGPSNQVLVYTTIDAAPSLTSRIGQDRGIFSGTPGLVGDLRFNRLSGVGVDSVGNVYVASDQSIGGGGTVLESYSPAGVLRWRVLGLEFVDCAALDPLDESSVYTREERFSMDWSKNGGGEWSYRGYTAGKAKYPDDPRFHQSGGGVWLRRLKGKPFLFVNDMYSDKLSVLRFNAATDGEIAVPSGLFVKAHVTDNGWPPNQPATGAWYWRDTNGNGQFDAGESQTADRDGGGLQAPDDSGGVWTPFADGLRYLPFQDVDASGNPRWDYSTVVTYPKPPELDEVRRLRYLPSTDCMVMGGNKGTDVNQHWKPMGPVLCRYDNYRSSSRAPAWTFVLPYQIGSSGHLSVEPMSFDVAGDYVFVAYTQGLEADTLTQAYVKVYRLSDHSFVTNLTHEKVLGQTGLLDIPESVIAARRTNGEYVVFLEDDLRAKVIMYRWCPTGSCPTTEVGSGPPPSAVKWPSGRCGVVVTDLAGRILLRTELSDGKDVTAMTRQLPHGVHLLQRSTGGAVLTTLVLCR